jgi:hypothetical protein
MPASSAAKGSLLGRGAVVELLAVVFAGPDASCVLEGSRKRVDGGAVELLFCPWKG